MRVLEMYEVDAVAKSKSEVSKWNFSIVISIRELLVTLAAVFLLGIVIAKAPEFIGLIIIGTIGVGALLMVKQERI